MPKKTRASICRHYPRTNTHTHTNTHIKLLKLLNNTHPHHTHMVQHVAYICCHMPPYAAICCQQHTATLPHCQQHTATLPHCHTASNTLPHCQQQTFHIASNTQSTLPATHCPLGCTHLGTGRTTATSVKDPTSRYVLSRTRQCWRRSVYQ